MEKGKMILFGCWLALAGAQLSLATDHYVRQGAAGNGSDWTNAYGQLPSTLVRDDTYYIADGSYNAYDFNTPVSGSLYVYVKKATATEHGTNTGWQNSYGDSTAGFVQLTLNTGYFDIDGVTGGGPGSWKTGHGFAFVSTAGTDRVFVDIATDVSHVRIRRIKFMEIGNTELGRYGAQGIANSSTVYDLLVERCYFENLNGLPFFFRGGSGVILQYNYTGDVCGCSVWSTDWHCEVLVCHSLSDVHFRWNYLSECPSSGGFVKNASAASADVRIYGNIFRDGYAVNCNTGTCPGWRIFNNTVATDGGSFGGDGARENWYVYNNIIFSSYGSAMPGDHGYNLYSEPEGNSCSMNAGPGENIVTRMPSNCDLITAVSDPFVNSSGDLPEDFKLAAALAGWSGYDVGQLDAVTAEKRYDLDIFGNTRGVDGVWDWGAAEYTVTGISNDEFRTSNAEWKKGFLFPNPLRISDVNLLNGVQLHDLQGNMVRPERIRQAGIFLVGTESGYVQKITVIK